MTSKSFKTTKKTAFAKCKKALADCACEIISSDFSSGTIEAKKGGNLLSYGHKILLSIKTTPSDKVKISVTSNSVGIQAIDWGTNSNNEVELIDSIADLL